MNVEGERESSLKDLSRQEGWTKPSDSTDSINPHVSRTRGPEETHTGGEALWMQWGRNVYTSFNHQ
jgi:hypothetical protein